MTAPTDKPCAPPGLTSYRYKGRYDWIMIGAASVEDALSEAARSIVGEVTPARLRVWRNGEYRELNCE